MSNNYQDEYQEHFLPPLIENSELSLKLVGNLSQGRSKSISKQRIINMRSINRREKQLSVLSKPNFDNKFVNAEFEDSMQMLAKNNNDDSEDEQSFEEKLSLKLTRHLIDMRQIQEDLNEFKYSFTPSQIYRNLLLKPKLLNKITGRFKKRNQSASRFMNFSTIDTSAKTPNKIHEKTDKNSGCNKNNNLIRLLLCKKKNANNTGIQKNQNKSFIQNNTKTIDLSSGKKFTYFYHTEKT